MNTKNCKECKQLISVYDYECTKCGYNPSYSFAKALVIVIIIALSYLAFQTFKNLL